MKRYFFVFLLSVLFAKGYSQSYGNEWINYNQKYYFFQITKEGVYRINHTQLVSANIPIASIDPRNIQLFGRGVELPIYIEGEGDGVFNSNDFIEFFAQPNDGFLDAEIYDSPSSQSNPYYSLFNDTAVYYITWNSSLNNKRLKLETSINFGSYSPASYHLKELKIVENSTYHQGETVIPPNTDAVFVSTEGWFSGAFTYGNSVAKTFSTSNLYSSGPPSVFSTTFMGQSNNAENPDHRITLEYKNASNTYSLLLDTIFDGYKQIKVSAALPSTLLSLTSTEFKFSSVFSPGIISNRTAIAYSALKFPHTFNFEGQSNYQFIMPDDIQGKSFIEVSNFSASGNVRLYDITNGKRISVVNSSGLYRALIPNAGGEKVCYLTSDGNINTITEIFPLNVTGAQFTNYTTANADYIIITHSTLLDGATSYAAYRNATGFNVLTVDVEELYHQFAYGIYKHPLAIRRFADLALNNWTKKPEYLFLIGKSMYLSSFRKSKTYYNNTLVPTFGLPPSDALLTAGLNGTTYEMAIPTGRLAAKTNDEVIIYLDKMIEYEASIVPPPEWKKQILHFGGGTSQSEQAVLSGYLNGYKKIIEDTLVGARVSSFFKSSTDPVQITLSDSIKKLMNGGTSMLTFFAHAAASTFDISLDDPSMYDNKGKYPVLFANACLSGDIHNPASNSTSEAYTFIRDKGVIGFLATVSQGFPPYLNMYATEMYKNIAYKMYGQSLGKMMQATSKSIQATSNYYLKDICLLTTLHGDPALKINSEAKPDIMISQPNVFFTPSEITTDLDSMKVNVILTNLGKSVLDSFNIYITKIAPDGSVETNSVWQNKLIFKDTVSIGFKINSVKDAGLSRFNIHADNTNLIDELTKTNNQLSVFLNIKSNDIIPVYPYNFAVVPNQGITLKASTGNPFAPAANYVFEVDTTDLFSSAAKQRTIINHSGGVLTWSPDLLKNMEDSAVFFWRVSPDSLAGGNYIWRESSFQYIKDKRGWGQAHFFQFKNDNYNYLEYERTTRKFNFESALKDLYCKTGGSATYSASNERWIEFKLDAVVMDYGGCGGKAAIMVAVIDSLTLLPWETRWTDPSTGIIKNPSNYFGNYNDFGACRPWRTEKFFQFSLNQAGIDGLTDMLNNKIPKGNYVLIYNYVTSNAQQWDFYNPGLHNELQKLGALGLRTLQDGNPFVFLAKVGYPSSAREVIGNAPSDVITLQTGIQNYFPFGDVSTELIGPSKSWKSFHWRNFSLENPSKDKASVDIEGIKSDGTRITLLSLSSDSLDVYNLENYIDASLYPYIQLKSNLSDDSLQTPPQLKRWQVLYEDVPEAALNASSGFFLSSDKLSEGDTLGFKIAISNISDLDMDSLVLKCWLEDEWRNIKEISYTKQKELKVDSTILAHVSFSTLGSSGHNKMWIEVNPKDQEWELEKYHFNNITQLSLNIERDKTNPILDVTFDGIHIMDKDIVSTKPMILMRLNDENKYLALNDTSSFAVFIKDPKGAQVKIPFVGQSGTETMRFTPAVLPKNSCSIEYHPHFTQDGEYELRVQAKDASENSSGAFDYVIKFNVITRSTITEVINYPNPFSTSTKFVFTLTGSEIPSNFKIQIMTVTGKVVKEITEAEIGQIRIGRNLTDYAWDGKDEFGDPLANGVYLYRVLTKINGRDIEKRETGADQYFHKGFGKMYLMR